MMPADPKSFHAGEMHQGWDEEAATAISRVAFINVLTGFLLGLIAGGCAVGLLVTL